MKLKSINQLLLLVCTSALLCGACSEWTEQQTVDQTVIGPGEQNPAAWAKYLAALRDYKKSEHQIAYARFANAPVQAVSERDFLRCMADSLDIVSLTNADNLSKFDLEDMPGLREKGTKILFNVDYATRSNEWADAATLGRYLDRVAASIAQYNLDGAAFSGIPSSDGAHAEVAALLVQKLAVAGKMLVFEGDPTFVGAADHAKVDYFLLNTEVMTNVTDVKMAVMRAIDYAGVPAEKIVLSATAGKTILDEQQVIQDAILEMAGRVISEGPLGGFAVFNANNDYYNSQMSYKTTREAIQMLNPSPIK